MIFINDIYSSVPHADLCLFADDTSLSLSNRNRDILEIDAFVQTSLLLQWLADNNLFVNTEKTKLIDFHLRTNQHNSGNSVVLVDDGEVYSCQHTNFLGLIIDSGLNFSEHIDKVSSKLNSCIFIIRRLSKFCGSNILLAAYYGCFFPHINYAVAIWGAESTKTKNIFRLQKKTIRLVFGLKRSDSCRGVFAGNGIFTFYCLYIYECLSLYIRNKLTFQSRNTTRYNLRNSHTLSIPHHKTTNFENQTYYSTIKLFNALPQHLKLESDMCKFRKKLKSFLIFKEYYSVRDYLTDTNK